jgi:hypothetical protein
MEKRNIPIGGYRELQEGGFGVSNTAPEEGWKNLEVNNQVLPSTH